MGREMKKPPHNWEKIVDAAAFSFYRLKFRSILGGARMNNFNTYSIGISAKQAKV